MKISKKIVSLLTMTFLTVTLYGNTSNASTKDTLTRFWKMGNSSKNKSSRMEKV